MRERGRGRDTHDRTHRHERRDRAHGAAPASGPLPPRPAGTGRSRPGRRHGDLARTGARRPQRAQAAGPGRTARPGALELRPRRRAGRRHHRRLLRRPDHRRPRGGREEGDRRRKAPLRRETHRERPRGRAGAGPAGPGGGRQERRRPGQALPARPAQAPPPRRGRLLRPRAVRTGRVRLLGLRGRLAGGAAPLLELPRRGRRRHRGRHVPALGVRPARAVRTGRVRPGAPGHPPPAPLGRVGHPVHGHRRRRRLRHLRTRRRHRRADQLLLGGPGAPRRTRRVPGRRHRGVGRRGPAPLPRPAPRAHPQTGLEPRPAGLRAVPRAVARGPRQRRVRQRVQGAVGAVPAACRPRRAWRWDLAAGARGVRLAELARRSSAEGRRLAVPEPGR